MTLSKQIKQKALDLGFDLVAITDACPINKKDIDSLKNWLNASFNGQMHYMEKNFQKRINPANLLEKAQSVIVTAVNYTPPTKLQPPNKTKPTGKIANYAQYQDYHTFIKTHLYKLAEYANSLTNSNAKYKICVDSVPLAERALAARAGIGFVAKNHMLTNPQLGSQLLLGEIITELKLESDTKLDITCKECDRCIRNCPTGALQSDGQFNANKCISYLTIELKDDIPPELENQIGDRLFGCDLCITTCPYNQTTPPCKNKDFKFSPEKAEIDLQKILNMEIEEFDTEFADSPIKRAGLEKLKSTAKTCLNNFIRRKIEN